MVRKDGTPRFMHVQALALRDASGALTGFSAAARDVTVRRQAEQELARLATAIEQSADAIVLTDPKGTILYVNPAFERVTGYAGRGARRQPGAAQERRPRPRLLRRDVGHAARRAGRGRDGSRTAERTGGCSSRTRASRRCARAPTAA